MSNKTFFTHDTAQAVFQDDADGISVDSDGETSFNWDEVEKVKVSNAPWAEAFETDEFYKLPATVARPIPQRYVFGQDELILKKPRQELKKAAWSLHNAPWTLNHPSSKMVRNVDQIHGFWRDPTYIDSMDRLNADLYLPVNDNEAQDFVTENGDVSVGFYNRMTAVDAYDGIVGGADDDSNTVDGYQTDMYFDHVASVNIGRCSSEEGCGIHDSPEVGTMTDAVAVHDGKIMDGQIPAGDSNEYDPEPFVDVWDNGDEVLYEHKDGSFYKDTLTTHDYRDEEGTYYAIAPDENADGVPKYPITSCSGENSVESAWDLRGDGHYNISQDTLEERIKRRADALDCDSVPWDEENTDNISNMTETDTQTDSPCGSLGLVDLSVDAIAAKHDGVQEAIDEKEARIEELEASIDEKEARIGELEELEAKVDEYESSEREELVSKITDLTDKWDEEELMAEEVDALEEKHELVSELAADDVTANGDGGETNKFEVRGPQRSTPWD